MSNLFTFPSANTMNTDFLTILTFNYYNFLSNAFALLVLLLLLFMVISAVTANNYSQPASMRHALANLLIPAKSFLSYYRGLQNKRLKFNITREYLSFNLLYFFMSLVNICSLILFPISPQYSGIQSDFSCLIVIACLLLNLLVFTTGVNYSDKNSTTIILRNSRLLSTVLTVIIVAALSVCSTLRLFSINSIVQIQQDRFLHTLPAWNILRNPLLLLNAFFFFIYTVILFQLLNQTDRPIPFKNPYSPLKSANTFSNRVIELWKFSFLALITFYYIFLFWGAYSSPIISGITAIGNISAIVWLLIKTGTFLILIRLIYRSIPHLIEEQILQFTYTFIFPIQIISLVLGLILLKN